MKTIYKNVFYFRKICKIGGTEQFLYEIAKKYKNCDITIFYDWADEKQLDRLRKYVRCKKRVKGEIVKCNRVFFNFNLDMIDDIESIDNYYAFVGHANYKVLGYEPPINHPKLTHFIGVSQFSTDKLDEWGKILKVNTNTIKCYNPLTLEPKEKVVHLVSACRLEDKTKGGERTRILIEAMDRYCEKHDRHYLFTIFTNPTKTSINSPNVVLMKPRIDVRPYIADGDWFVQLSDDMETYCYSDNEALGYGVPIVTTPLSILKELPITENEHIILNWDCSNVDEVVRQIFEKEVKPFKYIPPKDEWDKLLAKGESTYKEERKMKYLVEATDKYVEKNDWDVELSKQKNVDKYTPKEGEQWEVDCARKEKLEELGYVKTIREIEEESDVDKTTEEPKDEKEAEIDKEETEEEPVEKSADEESKEEVSEDTKEETEEPKEEIIETAKKDVKTEKAIKNTTKKNK